MAGGDTPEARRAWRADAGWRWFALAGLLVAGALSAQDFPVDPAPPAPPASAPVPPPRPASKPKPAPAAVRHTTVEPTAEAIAAGPPEPVEEVGPPEADLIDVDALAGADLPRVATPFVLFEKSITPGEKRELRWTAGESFAGSNVATPLVVAHGVLPGPVLCMTAAVHGDELNGIEVVRRVLNDIDPQQLTGTVIGMPIVNLMGFSRSSRYLPDRRDLNRYFPGTLYGSAASRIAYRLFKQVVVHCDALVDFHTGSFDRANLPQVRGDLTIPSVLEFTRGFGATPVLHSPGSRGMLRLAATDHGIPAVTFEVGAPLRLEPEQIEFAVQAIVTLGHKMGMTRSFRMWSEPQATFYESKWVRVDSGGMLFSSVALGDRIREGQHLGKVVDPIRNQETPILSPFRGRVIGMALNQVVLPGFAAYHVGIETSEAQAAEEAAHAPAEPDAIEQMEGDQINEVLGEPRANEPREREPDEPRNDAADAPRESD
jgi:predicted deacylase